MSEYYVQLGHVASVRSTPTLITRLRNRYTRRRDVAVLSKLDDRILADIGLSRHDVNEMAKSSWKAID